MKMKSRRISHRIIAMVVPSVVHFAVQFALTDLVPFNAGRLLTEGCFLKIILPLAKLYVFDHQSIPAKNLFISWSAFSVECEVIFMRKDEIDETNNKRKTLGVT